MVPFLIYISPEEASGGKAMCVNYWELFTKQNEFIFRHVQEDRILHNWFQGTKYTWYPVYACPIVTNDPEHMIACITNVIVAENDSGSEIIYDFFLLSSSENPHNTNLTLKRATVNGIMEPDQSFLFGEMIFDLFPDYVNWMFASPVPVLEGQRNHELDEQRK